MIADCLTHPAFAFFRNPNQNRIGYIGSETPVEHKRFGSQCDGGFIFSPFDSDKYPICHIPGEPRYLSYAEFDRQKISRAATAGVGNRKLRNTDKDDFIRWIRRFKSVQHSTHIQKVVFSAVRHIPLPERFNAIDYFHDLVHRYPQAFVSLFYSTNTGMWVGASPELLVKKTRRHIESIALAATKKTTDASDWDRKDYDEFDSVNQYIRTVFEEFGLSDTRPAHPETIPSGPVKHLGKYFKAVLPDTFPIHDFILRLHPTPAICGFPGKSAKETIYANERHDREYYAGYLGVLSPECGQLYVNIRCAKILPSHLKVFAGVGVIANSDPDSEWDEMRCKQQVLAAALPFSSF